jgi:hypothetical protein
MWRVEHLRAQPRKKQVQAMRRVEHLRAQPKKKPVQAMRRVEQGSRFNVERNSVAIRVTFQHHQKLLVYEALRKEVSEALRKEVA